MPHHQENSLLIHWHFVALAITIERLFQMRFLHRGPHVLRSRTGLGLRIDPAFRKG